MVFTREFKWGHFLLLSVQKKPSIRCPAYLAVSGNQFRNATVAVRRSHGNAFQIHPKAIGRGPQFTFNCSASPHLKYLFPLFLLSRTLLCNHQLRDLSITVGTQVKRQCFSRFPFSQLLCSVQHRPRSSRFRIFWLRDRQMAQMKRLIVSLPIEIHSTRVLIQRSRRSVFPKHHHSCRSSLPGDHQHSIGLHAKWNNRNISPSACAMHVWRIILSRRT